MPFRRRYVRSLRGRGDYWSDLFAGRKKWYSAIPRVAGLIGGSMLGAPAAGFDLGGQLSSLWGWGKYKARRGVYRGSRRYSGRPQYPWRGGGRSGNMVTKGHVPMMHGFKNGIRVKHQEIVGPILSVLNQTTASGRYFVNPGDPVLFPWLHFVAQCFEGYRMNGLVFTYVPTCGALQNVIGQANMTMASSPNVHINPEGYQTVSQLLTLPFSATGLATKELVIPVEEARGLGGQLTNHTLVRRNTVPNQTATEWVNTRGDLALYDDAIFMWRLEGIPANTAATEMGKLMVSYDVSLFNPTNSSALFAPMNVHLEVPETGTGVGSTNLFGADESLLTQVNGDSDIPFTWTTGNSITLDHHFKGNFLVNIYVSDVDAQLGAPAVTAMSNCGGVNYLKSNTIGQVTTVDAITTLTYGQLCFMFYVDDTCLSNPVITFANYSTDGREATDIHIVKVDADIGTRLAVGTIPTA